MIQIKGTDLERAAKEGMDAFLKVFQDAYRAQMQGGELSTESMQLLSADQHTLYAYLVLRDEIMEGGFIQLIQNGWGAYMFHNPVAKALKSWGLDELSQILYDARRLYDRNREQLERESTDEEFMAMYEQWPEFEPLEERFIEEEEQWTGMVACYVDDHLDLFAEVI